MKKEIQYSCHVNQSKHIYEHESSLVYAFSTLSWYHQEQEPCVLALAPNQDSFRHFYNIHMNNS